MNSNDAFRNLFQLIHTDLNKIFDKQKIETDITRVLRVQQSLISPWKGNKKKIRRRKNDYYNENPTILASLIEQEAI